MQQEHAVTSHFMQIDDTDGRHLFYLQNQESKDLVVKDLCVEFEGDSAAELLVQYNTTPPSGNTNFAEVVNLSNTPIPSVKVLALVWNFVAPGMLGISGGKTISSIFLQNGPNHLLKRGLVLEPGASIAIVAAMGSVGSKLSFNAIVG